MDDELMKDAGVYAGTFLALSISLAGAILLLVNRNYDGTLEYILILLGFILSVAFVPAFLIVTLGVGNKPQSPRRDDEEPAE